MKLNHPVLGETFSDRGPIRFPEDQTSDWKAAPLLGQDNRYVYINLLGLTEEEFAGFVTKGVFD